MYKRQYKYLRYYPNGELWGQLTGYYSRIYGRTGLEQAMNPYLSGTAPEFATQNLTDIILGRPKRGGTVITTLVPRVQATARRALGTHLYRAGPLADSSSATRTRRSSISACRRLSTGPRAGAVSRGVLRPVCRAVHKCCEPQHPSL